MTQSEQAKPDDPRSELESEFQKDSRPYFDADKLGESVENRYVAWLDLMGAKSIMGRSLRQAANFIAKIHIVVQQACPASVSAYPVIDGVYIVTEKRSDLETTLKKAMRGLAATFVHETMEEHRFLVRGGIAAGRIIRGQEIAKGSSVLAGNPNYAACLAIGSAIGQAYSAEQHAPPFGFYVDITARSFTTGKTQPFMTTLWRWWEDDWMLTEPTRAFGTLVLKYLDWAEANRRSLEYPLERLREHRDAAREYFGISSPQPPKARAEA